jgi:hypothetical protein
MSSSDVELDDQWGDSPVLAVHDIHIASVAEPLPIEQEQMLDTTPVKRRKRTPPWCIENKDDAIVVIVRDVPTASGGSLFGARVRVVVHKDGRVGVFAEDLRLACSIACGHDEAFKNAFWNAYDSPRERVTLKCAALCGRPRMVLTSDGILRFMSSNCKARKTLSHAMVGWFQTRLFPVVFDGKRAAEEGASLALAEHVTSLDPESPRSSAPPSFLRQKRAREAVNVNDVVLPDEAPSKQQKTAAPFLDLTAKAAPATPPAVQDCSDENYRNLFQRALVALQEAEATGEFNAFYVPLEPGDLPTSQLRLIQTFTGPTHGNCLRASDCNGLWFERNM